MSNPMFSSASSTPGTCEYEVISVAGVKKRRNPVEYDPNDSSLPILKWGSRIRVNIHDVENMTIDKESGSYFFRVVNSDESEYWVKMYHRGDWTSPNFEKCVLTTGSVARLEWDQVSTDPLKPARLRCAHPDCSRAVARHCRYSDFTIRKRCCGKGFCEKHLCHWRNDNPCAGILFPADGDTIHCSHWWIPPGSYECDQCPACKANTEECTIM